MKPPSVLSKRYKKPVLIEIFAECFLASGTLPGPRFFDIVPALKTRGFTNIEFVGNVQMTPEEGPSMQPRVRCWSADKKQLIQIAEDLVIVNLVGEYPGWKPFTDLFELAIREVARAETAIKILNLNTIDRFVVPAESYALERYVNCSGEIVPTWYRGSKEPLDITLGHGVVREEGWNRQVNVKVRRRDGISIEFRVTLQRTIGTQGHWRDTLQELHNDANRIFETLITDATRKDIMGGLVS